MQAFLFLAIILQAYLATAFYSIGFYNAHESNQIKLMNTGATFTSSPSAEQVADICSRLSGESPMLWEGIDVLGHIETAILIFDLFLDKINLPAANYDGHSEKPLILEVYGGGK